MTEKIERRRPASPAASTSTGIPATEQVLRLQRELRAGSMKQLGEFELADFGVRLLAGESDLWALISRTDRGAVALRLAHTPGGCRGAAARRVRPGEVARISAESDVGRHDVGLSIDVSELGVLRAVHELTPRTTIRPYHIPRDLYPLGAGNDPRAADGCVEAAQRGPNCGICFLRMTEPAFGSLLYFQNLTALNDYCETTGTSPDGTVGGEWPELGYLPPTSTAPAKPEMTLPEGRAIVLTDALLVFHHDHCADEQNGAKRFLQMLGSAYRQLDLPDCEYRDWVKRSAMTLKDLAGAEEAQVRHYGHRYIHPYTSAEYPDVMVQMSLISSLHDWAAWTGAPVELEAELAAGLNRFHDRKLGTMRRYLPNVGEDKDSEAVDSWYLYHPLLGLGRLALDGDRRARRLLLSSIDYAIRAARHFDYKWPIQFKVGDFAVITKARNDDGLGQTDVGGIYAFVMTQAFQLTGELRFLEEARAAIDAAARMRFELEYQANLTAWGSAACMRLWRITGEEKYLRQSYVYLASFFHNTQIWQSKLGAAKHYNNFLGATCLHDAPYMAIYECFDSFAAFEGYLRDGGPDLDQSARMLVSEYCKYALSRAWSYYPDALPADILAPKQRNGHIARNLSFPLEDLYSDGQAPGQVGQEIYGSGAAFVFASRSFHRMEGAPFTLFCDHFLTASERQSERSMTVQLDGGDACVAHMSIIPTGRRKLPAVAVATADGDRIRPLERENGRLEFRVPATGRLVIHWTD